MVDAELLRGLAHPLHEVRRGELRLTALLALRVERGAQERHGGYAGDFQRILEGEEDAARRPLVRFERQQIGAFERHRAAGDLVVRLAGQHVRERRLARAVRSHDGVHLARLHGKIEALEDLPAIHRDLKVLDIEHCHVAILYKLKWVMISAISSFFFTASSPA